MNIQECRICLLDDHHETMISPCLCQGTQKYVHRECLNQWRQQNRNQGFFRCPTCLYEYRISRVWWANILSHKATSLVLSGLAMIGGIWGLGYMSAASYNGFYYWSHYLPWHTPHRLQVLFHGLFWVGLPGLLIGGKKLCENMREMREMREINPLQNNHANAPHNFLNDYLLYSSLSNRRETHHYHHNEKKKSEEKKSEEKHKPHSPPQTNSVPLAEYESKSCLAWTTVLAGAGLSMWYSFQWIYEKCLGYTTRLQEMVENV